MLKWCVVTISAASQTRQHLQPGQLLQPYRQECAALCSLASTPCAYLLSRLLCQPCERTQGAGLLLPHTAPCPPLAHTHTPVKAHVHHRGVPCHHSAPLQQTQDTNFLLPHSPLPPPSHTLLLPLPACLHTPVQAHVHHRGVVLENRRRPVAVVDVPIQYQHTHPGAPHPLRRARGHRCIVEVTKPHRKPALSVVPWRPDDGGTRGRETLDHGGLQQQHAKV